MIFNSWSFLFLFLPAVFVLYWFVFNKSLKAQNILLLFSSYVFYGLWNWYFLSLIVLSSAIDYWAARNIYLTEIDGRRKIFLYISIFTNLSILGVFKYFNFFAENLAELFQEFGIVLDLPTLNVILPVGISFYTFQSLGYTIDVYKRKIAATDKIIEFFCFVSFFPQLVAGPIERAKHLLPQFFSARGFKYEYAKEGIKLILWGLVMKVVIADTCGKQVDYVYSNFSNLSSVYVFLGQFYFLFQLYGDFAGYSLIAIGVAKLFGFNLSKNFSYPFFSRSIPEFWTKWHMTLTNWFTDYVFTPIVKKNIKNRKFVFLSYLITLCLIGFWHGPKWTLIFAIGFTAFYFIPRIFFNVKVNSRKKPNLRDIPSIIKVFLIVFFHLIFFRAVDMSSSFQFLKKIFEFSIYPLSYDMFYPLALLFPFIIIEWNTRTEVHPLGLEKLPKFFRWMIYLFLTYLVFQLLDTPKPYIYFQF
ncbi:MAG: MBOAT family protein [Melioribacteraceae bacterium]|nr:MBOAT family protein [Melioribacteraceae bacterium]